LSASTCRSENIRRYSTRQFGVIVAKVYRLAHFTRVRHDEAKVDKLLLNESGKVVELLCVIRSAGIRFGRSLTEGERGEEVDLGRGLDWVEVEGQLLGGRSFNVGKELRGEVFVVGAGNNLW